MSFLNKFKTGASSNAATSAPKPKKEPPVELTPLEKMLANAGPIRDDGSDKFIGLENFGNSCFTNSMVQVLYNTPIFRQKVLEFALPLPTTANVVNVVSGVNGVSGVSGVSGTDSTDPAPTSDAAEPDAVEPDALDATESTAGSSAAPSAASRPRKIQVSIRNPTEIVAGKHGTAAQAALNALTNTPPANGTAANAPANRMRPLISVGTASTFAAGLGSPGGINVAGSMPGAPGAQPAVVRPEDKPDAPEYKKKMAMMKGPVIELTESTNDKISTDSDEVNLFLDLKDIFTALVESESRTGVLSPHRLFDDVRKSNEVFSVPAHHDAHEFYGHILNNVITSVEALTAKQQQQQGAVDPAVRGSEWVHDLFEGVLANETRCLTCERTSQRDEVFLDLSIDVKENNSSVTSCLQKFSAEEMLLGNNKYICDNCGDHQEAERRMKIKRPPKILALHLKRFHFDDKYEPHKLFHRVVYPYQLRMMNTTANAEGAERPYELYAVVVHIGSMSAHGHYVALIKTRERGWLMYDDEMVEPVDKHYVRNFFGTGRSEDSACAYVLFYQETTDEQMQADDEHEGLEEMILAEQAAAVHVEEDKDGEAKDKDKAANGAIGANGASLARPLTQPTAGERRSDELGLEHAKTAPDELKKERKEREKREAKEAKEARAAAKEADKARRAQAKEAQKEVERQRRAEADEVRRAIAASKQTAADESQPTATPMPVATTTPMPMPIPVRAATSRDETNGESSVKSLLSRSKSMSRKSFGFLGVKSDKSAQPLVPVPKSFGPVPESPFDEADATGSSVQASTDNGSVSAGHSHSRDGPPSPLPNSPPVPAARVFGSPSGPPPGTATERDKPEKPEKPEKTSRFSFSRKKSTLM